MLIRQSPVTHVSLGAARMWRRIAAVHQPAGDWPFFPTISDVRLWFEPGELVFFCPYRILTFQKGVQTTICFSVLYLQLLPLDGGLKVGGFGQC